MHKYIKEYSFWQYRFYLMSISIVLFIKFLFPLVYWQKTNISLAEAFAAGSALLSCINIFCGLTLVLSLLIIGCAWFYIFVPLSIIGNNIGNLDNPAQIEMYIEVILISLILLLPAILSLQLFIQKKKRNSEKKWVMPAWLLTSAQIFFILSLIAWFYSTRYLELVIMQFLLFLFAFDPRLLPPTKLKDGGYIIFFDGLCNLCNRWIAFVFDEDHNHIFRFASLQGQSAQALLAQKQLENLDQVILYEKKQKTYAGFEAVLRIANGLGGLWRLLAWSARLIPKPIGNATYGYVASRRYQWFGRLKPELKQGQCSLPSLQAKAYFLP